MQYDPQPNQIIDFASNQDVSGASKIDNSKLKRVGYDSTKAQVVEKQFEVEQARDLEEPEQISNFSNMSVMTLTKPMT